MIIGQLLSLVLGFSLLAAFGITTDQIMQNVYDSTNTALRTNLVAGGSGSVGPGTVNNLAKFTPSTTTIGNSGITDDGAGAIGIYPAAASPQATTWTFASATGADHAGANTTFKASGSTGTALGGSILFQTTNKATTGSTPNTYGTVLGLSAANNANPPINYVNIAPGTSTVNPTISLAGSASDIGLTVQSKGNGGLIDLATNSTALRLTAANAITNVHDLLAFCNGAVTTNCNTLIGQSGTTANTLQLGGNDNNTPSAQTIKAISAASGNNTGSALTVKAGAATGSGTGGAATFQGGAGGTGGATTVGGNLSAGTDIAGGLTTIQGGIATGAAVPGRVTIQTGNVLATGTTAQTLVDRYDVGVQKVLANNTVTPMVSFTMANNTVVAGNATYSCQVFDGSQLQIEEGQISFHETNLSNTPANNTVIKYGNQQAMTSGSLTVTWTITAASPAVLSVNCNSSLTPSTGYPILTYAFHNLTNQAAAIQ